MNKSQSNLRTIDDIMKGASFTNKGPASLSNAGYLKGDPGSYGWGDVDPLAMYDLLSGDPDEDGDPEIGDLKSKLKNAYRAHPKLYNIAAGTLGGVALGQLTGINKRIATGIKSTLTRLKMKQGLFRSRAASQSVSKTSNITPQYFVQIAGGKLSAAPLDPYATFSSGVWKWMLNKQAAETPFLADIVTAVPVGATLVATATGDPVARYYTALIVQIGTNVLAANPSTIVTIAMDMPLINSTVLSVSSNPWKITYDPHFNITFKVFPWVLVTNKPYPVMGSYDNTAPARNIVVTVSGVPTSSTVNLVVPGPLHPWVSTMRESLDK